MATRDASTRPATPSEEPTAQSPPSPVAATDAGVTQDSTQVPSQLPPRYGQYLPSPVFPQYPQYPQYQFLPAPLAMYPPQIPQWTTLYVNGALYASPVTGDTEATVRDPHMYPGTPPLPYHYNQPLPGPWPLGQYGQSFPPIAYNPSTYPHKPGPQHPPIMPPEAYYPMIASPQYYPPPNALPPQTWFTEVPSNDLRVSNEPIPSKSNLKSKPNSRSTKGRK
ncbi:hypothetical protein BC629DRAFT_1597320 [Irpex lacteus]|nr:hypothetical protein BC629DRAFT_1597320 [Irpex lacteus]